jgi:hypothetical protein
MNLVQDSPVRGQAVRVRLGSTSTMISAIHVMKIAMMVQTAGLYPFFAASHAVSTTGTIQSTSPNNISGNPMFGTKTSSPSAARPRGQTITRTRL